MVDTLSRIYNAAEDRGLIPEASNPCRLVVKNRERRRERFLTDEELRRLGRVLDDAETRTGVSAHAVAAIRLLLLTGCRKGEILSLRWGEVDLEARELRLHDSKTGPADDLALAGSRRRAGGDPEDRGQPLCDPGQGRGQAHAQSQRPLGDRPASARRLKGPAYSRLQAFVCVAGARARRVASDDRAAARSHAGGDDGALCSSGEGFGTRLGAADFGEYLPPIFSKAHQLAGRQHGHAEHQVGENLVVAPYANMAAAELVLEPRIDPLGP